MNDTDLLARPLNLPCGVQLKNRLIKSAMSDSLGDGAGNPTDVQTRLYERWAEGGAALSIIGEVQITPDCPEKPGNLVLTSDGNLEGFRALASRGANNGTQIWPQLGHAGALAYAPVSMPKGPSPLNIEGLCCDGLAEEDLRALPGAYADAAGLARDLGFVGVQLHAGHGFLLSQFLSPLFNRRTDGYGGGIAGRFRIVGEIIDAVRSAVGPAFPIGIKINSSDLLEGGLTPDDALTIVRLLDDTSIDLIDISGGTYFPGAASSSDRGDASGIYFLDFAKKAKSVTTVPIAVTGGVKTRAQAADALRSGAADAVSIARGMVIDPNLAKSWLSPNGGDPAFPTFDAPPAGGVTAWYTMRLTALGQDAEAHFDMAASTALESYDRRDLERVGIWRARFGR